MTEGLQARALVKIDLHAFTEVQLAACDLTERMQQNAGLQRQSSLHSTVMVLFPDPRVAK